MADNKNLEKKDAKKDKKPGLGKKISKFFREYKSELKKISWPTLPEVIKNSLVTIAVVAIVGLFIWGVDTVLTLGRDAILKTDKVPGISQGTESDTDLNNTYGYKIEELSTTEIISKADLSAESASDLTEKSYFVVTKDGKIVLESITSNSDAANTMLNNFIQSEKIEAQLNANVGNQNEPVVTDTNLTEEPTVTETNLNEAPDAE